MSNSLDQLRSLVEGLYAATNQGRIRWQKVSNSDSYMSSIADSLVEIREDVNSKGEPLFIVNLYDKDGKQVDSVNDEYFGRAEPVHVQHTSYFSLLRNLNEMARRNATGADEIVRRIIDALGTPQIDNDIPF